MTFRANLVKARSQIAFIVGLSLAATFALSVESRVNLDSYRTGRGIQPSAVVLPLAPVSVVRREDFENARIAWAYFEKNLQPATGLVNSANGYPSTTIWDQASYLLALISAERIGVISLAKFDERLGKVLDTLAKLPLFDGKLPNKVYNTQTLEMTNYANNPAPKGIGWSALDVARISVPLNIILFDYPSHTGRVTEIFSTWNFRSMVQNGVLNGSRVVEETGAVELIQEGRLGYEEYAARAISLLGLDAMEAAKYDDFVRFEKIGGQSIAVDSRSHTFFDAHTVVVSEPYILTAIEFGLDTQARELAQRVFLAQVSRYQETGRLTAVSEDNIDQTPYFLYNSVFADGKKWSALAEDGSEHDDKRTVSTKAAFGWDALYRTDYTERLVRHVGVTNTPDNGFNSGVYEKDNRVNAVATANTNGIILETILYRMRGPLITSRFLNAQGEKQ